MRWVMFFIKKSLHATGAIRTPTGTNQRDTLPPNKKSRPLSYADTDGNFQILAATLPIYQTE